MNILLVDNNETDIINIKNAFIELVMKPNLHLAKSEEEALSKLEGGKKLTPLPKIILLDIQSDGIDGIKLLKIIRGNPVLKPILVFVLNNVDDETIKIEAYNLNIAGYIRKNKDSIKMKDIFSVLQNYWDINEFIK